MGISRIGFIVASTIFFLFVIQIGGAIGEPIITGFDPATTFNQSIQTDPVKGFFNNIGYFQQLMAIDSSVFLFGTVLITAYILGMVIVVLEMIRGN